METGMKAQLQYLPVPAALLCQSEISLNAPLARLLGLTEGEIITPAQWWDFLLPNGTRASSAQFIDQEALHFPAPLEYVLRNRSGAVRRISINASITPDGTLCIVTPLDDDHAPTPDRMPGQIDKDNLGDMLYWLDHNGRIISVNQAACEATGFSHEALLAMHISQLDQNFNPDAWAFIWRSLRKRRRFRFDTIHRRADGTLFDVEISTQHVVIEGAEYACSSARDITERKQAEEALRVRLSTRENLLTNLAGMVYRRRMDEAQALEYVSAGAEALTGYTVDELLDAAHPGFLHPADRDNIQQATRSGTEAGGPFVLEYRIKTKAGATRWVRDIAHAALQNGSAKPAAVEGFISDITAQKEAERRLQRMEDLLQQAGRMAKFGAWEMPLDTLAPFGSDEVYRILDVDIGAPLTFDRAIELIPLDRRESTRQSILAALEARAPFDLEFPIRTRLDRLKWIRVIGKADTEATKSPRVYGVVHDITQRREAEAALQESQLLFMSFMLNNPAVAFIKDADGRMLFVNQAFVQQLWNNDPPEWQGKRDHELWSQAEADRLRSNDLQVLNSMQAHEYEECITRGDAHSHWLTIKFPIQKPDGNVLLGGMALDITSRKEAELEKIRNNENMIQTQKLESLGILAGGIAHDFNNLLTGIMGYADLGLLDAPKDSDAARSLEQICKASKRAAELTRQMLAYSGKGRFVLEAIDLGALIRDTVSLLDLAISKRCSITYDLANAPTVIEGDPTQIRQVVMNLVINASEAIGNLDGAIRITTGRSFCDRKTFAATYLDEGLPEGDYIFLEVTDTGIGMSPETRDRIFDPFFSTKFPGRGLGMAAVLGIIRGHHGAILVESAENKGTAIRVYFPASALPLPAEPAPTQQPAMQGAGTILIVDDEESVRTVAAEMLTHLGYTPLIAVDGLEAVQAFSRHRAAIQAILLDATMPHLDGPETLSALRRIAPSVHVIMASGYSAQEILSRCEGGPPNAFIEKPYTLATLAELLRSIPS